MRTVDLNIESYFWEICTDWCEDVIDEAHNASHVKVETFYEGLLHELMVVDAEFTELQWGPHHDMLRARWAARHPADGSKCEHSPRSRSPASSVIVGAEDRVVVKGI